MYLNICGISNFTHIADAIDTLPTASCFVDDLTTIARIKNRAEVMFEQSPFREKVYFPSR